MCAAAGDVGGPVGQAVSHILCCSTVARSWASNSERDDCCLGPGAEQAPAPSPGASASLMKPSHLVHVTYYNCNCN